MADWKKKKSSHDDSINIELSEKHSKLRVILFVLVLAFGLTMIGRGLYLMLTEDPGWRAVEPNKTEELNCSEDFVFMYNIGASGISATQEYRDIVSIYSDATMKAYQLFTSYSSYEDINNVYYINQHPNEEIEVDEVLYEAFSLLQKYENRNIYLAPVYVQYDDLFYCEDDSLIKEFDPFTNEEVAEYYQEIATYAADSQMVDIQLLGDHKIMLYVSDEYMDYAEENYISTFIDFFWMKNAFIVDYLADVMITNGYTLGTISSFDGFVRNLDDSETTYSFNIFDKAEEDDDGVYAAAIMQYSGQNSIVYLRNYSMYELDTEYYYQLDNGEVRTSYLDIQDGKCRSAMNNLVSYSYDMGCAEVLMQTIPVYITETLDETAIEGLQESGIYSVYCVDKVIKYNDSNVNMEDVFENETVKYTLEKTMK